MPTCDYCGTTILFGGVKQGEWRFCNDKCRQRGILLDVGHRVPEEIVANHVQRLHNSNCPVCGGPGPIDVHTSHKVTSFIIMTWFGSHPRISCSGCGTRARLMGVAHSALLGWWGFPFGLLITPVQILRNLAGILASGNSGQPSDQLEKLARMQIAAHVMANPPRRSEEPEIVLQLDTGTP
jgi:hypothetical protein